jgi:hypothetical protein
MATDMFVLPTIAMALFLLVWIVTGLLALCVDWRAREGRCHSALELRNRRGLRLLKNWLSPAQLRSYEQHGYFEVTGSDSGTIYRIHHGQQANVEQIDAQGQTVCAWCFVPVGDLVAGDVMLAQKIALETDERTAMAVAVKHAILLVRRRIPQTPPRLPASHLGVM